MKWFWHHLRLKGKFRMLLLIGFIIWLSAFSIIYFEILGINQAIVDLENCEDVYNTILEVRRYEKNFLLYHHRTDLEETLLQFNRARLMLTHLLDETGAGKRSTQRKYLESAMEDYLNVFYILIENPSSYPPNKTTQEKIRTAGKQIVDLSYDLLAGGKRRVTVIYHRALLWPVIAMGLFLVVFTVGAFLVSRKVIQPLIRLEEATTKIGRGDFGPIHHSTKEESEVDHLILAFNRMSEELEARQEQIIHSRKIASLGTLVSGVAHELNNPINNIILTIDSLLSGRKIEEERRNAMLNDIFDQTVRASGIVKNLLDFSRAETTTIEDLDIAQVLQETIQITENQITLNNIKLRTDIAADLPVIEGTRQTLQQVFINLLTNAVHAMPSGGELSIRAALNDDRTIIITVQDTGCGIAEEHLPYIFDPFFTTKDVGKGTGLGLSVSYGVIKKHGGRITVDSSPGKGSTFTIILPVKEEMIDG